METYWSRFSEGFDDKQAYTAGAELISLMTERLAAKKNLGDVLEFGCGNGRYTRSIVEQARSVVATDYSKEMVEAASRILSDCRNVSVAQADCHETSYEAASFDTVMMANLIHVVDRPEVVVREAKRLLKPEGMLLITSFTIDGMSVLNKLRLVFRYKRTFGAFPKHTTMFTVDSLRRLLTAEGFVVKEAALIGKKTHAVFIEATRRSDTE
jgi:ubiquinone/menaquinone biosynthesis C-methylase UbiE